MKIKPQDIESRKVVGRLKNKPIWNIRTKGGRDLLISGDGPNSDILGVGSHPAISRLIAKTQNPDIVFTDLNKGNIVDEATIRPYIEQFQQLTEYYQSQWKKFNGK